MTVYADASVMASMILQDGNSVRAKALLHDFEGSLVWTDLLKLEVFNAIRMAVGDGRLTEVQAAISRNLAQDLCTSGKWQWHEPDWNRVFGRAQGLSGGHASVIKARSLDILHVASAIELGITNFWSFDKRQLALAVEGGLRVNP